MKWNEKWMNATMKEITQIKIEVGGAACEIIENINK